MPLRKSKNILRSAFLLSLIYPTLSALLHLTLSLQSYADSSLTWSCIINVFMISSLFLAVNILPCQILPHKREPVVTGFFVHYAQLDFTKMTFLIAVYLVGILYHLQQSMLAPFRVLNAFYPMSICHLLRIVSIFKFTLKDKRKWRIICPAILFPKFTCNVVFNFSFSISLHVT